MKLKLSFFKSLGDSFLYLAVWGILTGLLGEEFYPFASWIILICFFINLSWIIKELAKRK